MNKSELLKIKRAKKSVNPKFKRQDSHKKKEVSRTGWRKPRGHQSKIKHNFRSYGKKVRPGYGTPSVLRNTNREGLLIVNVYNIPDVTKLNSGHLAVIGSSVGLKNKLLIAQKCEELKIKTLPTTAQIKVMQERLAAEKSSRKKAAEDKKKKKSIEEKVKKEEKPKEEAPEVTDEEKKELEKKEKDKILITKES